MEEQKKSISSRGIPSKEAMHLPPYNSPSLRKFQDSNEVRTRNLWGLEEVINFIFPKEYQETYNKIACRFMKMVVEKNTISGAETGKFISENGISKATFYRYVSLSES